MVFAAPEFVVAEPVEMLDEIEIAAKLQHRMLADRMMRGEEGAEIQTRHDGFSCGAMMHDYSTPSTIRRSRSTALPRTLSAA